MIGALFNAFTLIGSEWVMWVLMGLSLVSFAIIFDRMRSLRNQERLGAQLWKEKIDTWMTTGSKPDFKALSAEIKKSYPCLEGALLETLAQQENTKENLEKLSSSFLGRKKLELEKNMSFLGTVGSNAPFIGLFGTVLGIIRAFHDLGGKVENAGAQSISVGISEALVATAVGLMVAIPAVMFFNYFQRKIKMIMGRAESLSNYLISLK
jgi:biopolymer transport protein ExbB